LNVVIGPEMRSVVAHYIARTKNWKPDDYRIEDRGDVIAVIHLEDERAPHPGRTIDRAAC